MPNKLLSVILLVLVPSIFVYSQEGNWEVYMARYEKGPGTTILNMDLQAQAPDAKYPFLLTTGVSFSDCSADGMPTKTVFPHLYDISDSVVAVVDRTVANIFSGTFTYQCERLDYFYLSDTTGIRAALARLYASHFASYKPAINIRADAEWEAYLKFLYPNEETFETIQNQKVVLKLSEAGDKLLKARKVDHWIYFKTATDRDCFEAYAVKNKFKIELKDKTGPEGKVFKLQMSRTDKVDIPAITEITLRLRKEAAACGGDYDGWETFAIK